MIHGIRTFVPIMLDQDEEGHVVNTASTAGLTPGNRLYSVTKHGVVALSEALSRRPAGPRCQVALPPCSAPA